MQALHNLVNTRRKMVTVYTDIDRQLKSADKEPEASWSQTSAAESETTACACAGTFTCLDEKCTSISIYCTFSIICIYQYSNFDFLNKPAM